MDKQLTSYPAYGVKCQGNALEPMQIKMRSSLRPDEVCVEVKYSGVCHSDIHHGKNDWMDSIYPMVPGHEIVGIIVDVGSNAEVPVGQLVGIGNMIDSCRVCERCLDGDEQVCLNGGPSFTYNSHERYIGDVHTLEPTGAMTFGGYGKYVICDKNFIFKMPENIAPHRLPPLLCAATAIYWPLKYLGVGPGSVVGIAGIGGLGHLGIMMAKALGAKVIAISRTAEKMDDCMGMGADDFVLSTLDVDRTKYTDKMDIILSTVPVAHDPTPYFNMVKPRGGKLHILGNFNSFPGFEGRASFFNGKQLTGSNILGVGDTQEMLDWCDQNNIVPIVELIPIAEINKAWKSVQLGTVRYRYVIDMSTL